MSVSSASLKSYNRLVSWGRKGALGLLGCFFMALMSWPSLIRVSKESSTFVDLSRQAVRENCIENPRFSSLSEKGAPYEVWAEEGRNMASETVSLVHPQGWLLDPKGQEMKLEAQEGLYKKGKKTLVLMGNVRLFLVENVRVKENAHMKENMYALSTRQATVDMEKKEVRGIHPVEGEGPVGSLKGERFWIKNNGESLWLEGKSHLVIRSSKSFVSKK